MGFLPYAVIGPFIGILVDRYNRKAVIIAADLTVASAAAVLPLAAMHSELPLWMIMAVLFIRSVGSAFHSTALNAATPMLVPAEELTKCAGYSQSVQSLSYVLSPALAAVLYSIWPLSALAGLDVAGALAASGAVAMVRIPELEAEQRSTKPNWWDELREGFTALRKDKGLFALLMVGTLYMLIYMPINALYPLMSMDYFGGTPVHLSITESAYALGMLVGGLVLGLAGSVKKRIPLVAGSIMVMGLSLTVSGLLRSNQFIVFAMCCAAMGLSVPFFSGIHTALFQERISPEYLGRVFSLTGSIMSLSMPLGLTISGIFADGVGVQRWFLLSGIVIIGVSMLCVALPAIRDLDRTT